MIKLAPEQVKALHERMQAFEANNGLCVLHGKDADGGAVGIFEGSLCITIAVIHAGDTWPMVYVAAELSDHMKVKTCQAALVMLRVVADGFAPPMPPVGDPVAYAVPVGVLWQTMQSLVSKPVVH
jgi:hypothetical protein